MRRGLLLLMSLALLGVLPGCKTHEVADPSSHIAAHPGNPMPPPAGVPGPIRSWGP